jgi:hypothetical protein
MATLKKLTRVGADVRQIARLLQAKAPEGHMLAYITPDEAKLLKSQGGSGKLHENTGIPSFQMDDSGGYDTGGFEGMTQEQLPESAFPQVEPYVGPGVTRGEPETANIPSRSYTTPVTVMDSGPSTITSAQPQAASGQAPYVPYDMSFGAQVDVPGGRLPSAMTMGAGEPQAIDTAREEPSFVDKLKSYYSDMKPETLQRLGLAGGLGLVAAYQSEKAKKEAEKAKKEQQDLAAPYQQKGAELQRAAQAGELTPAAQQQLQAVQAQAAQQAASRGGAVGQAQTQAQVEAFRSQLLQQQYDYGLKLSGIGDNIALGAIKTGMQADQYVNQLTANYASNIARTLYGVPPAQQTQAGVTT